MFILYAEKNKLIIRKREAVTSGSVNVNQVRFEFSPEWEELKKTAVFRAGEKQQSMLLDPEGVCSIPWEVTAVQNLHLMAGVYGTRSGAVVLPTIWADLGTILEGVPVGDGVYPPSPEVWEQALAGKADGMDLDGVELHLLSGKKTLASVRLPAGGGGEGGASDHRLLTGRDAEQQHPIGSITGLAEALNTIPSPTEALTNEELEAILT